MKTSILKLSFLLIFPLSLFSQQWSGSTNISGNIQRTGIVGIGLTNPPTDTQLYVKSTLKVGFLAEVNHTIDFQFGITSAVNRANTKAFSVLLKNSSGNYEDKFAVMGDGKVKATEVTVKIPVFPDYVFENDYNLMPLKEVESFVKLNKHLPQIPTAKEIEKDGLELGNIQVKQMEKIEELFLYIIELNNKIEFLENQVKEMKNSK